MNKNKSSLEAINTIEKQEPIVVKLESTKTKTPKTKTKGKKKEKRIRKKIFEDSIRISFISQCKNLQVVTRGLETQAKIEPESPGRWEPNDHPSEF